MPLEPILGICQTAFKADLARECVLKVATLVARQIFDAPKEIAYSMPGLRSLFESGAPEQLLCDVAAMYVNMFMANPNKDVMGCNACNFLRNLFDSGEVVHNEIKISLATTFISRMFRLQDDMAMRIAGIFSMKLWEDGEIITADLAIELATAFARRL